MSVLNYKSLVMKLCEWGLEKKSYINLTRCAEGVLNG
mgnify:CR=1 FL=1